MKINYHFTFEDGTRKVFKVNLDPESLNVISSDNQAKPEWARLANCRCQHCHFDENEVQYCPIAVNLIDVVHFFKAYTSYDKVKVLVITEDRLYGKKTTIQRALGSLLGVYMAASGCPSMEKLKPMVRFHPPLPHLKRPCFVPPVPIC